MKAVFKSTYQESRFKIQESGHKVHVLFPKFFIIMMVLIAGFAARADVPPPKNLPIDTTYNAGEIKNMTPVNNQHVEMATGMRSNGKIYVVVAVLCMILIGLFVYLFSLDKKIAKLEKVH